MRPVDIFAFCQSIASPALRAVALVWSYRFDPDSGDFVGRLAGNRIAQAYGRSFRGLRLSHIHNSPERFARTFALFQRAISEPAIFRGSGRVFQLKGKFESGERIMLPLSTDGLKGDSVFGATESGGLPVIHDQPVEPVHDIGDWFSLSNG